MFEELAKNAATLLLVIFWIIVISIAVWGAWWVRSVKSVH
jgi:hypothetical protein